MVQSNHEGFSRTELNKMVIIPLSEAKDRACKHAKELFD